jgi:hypothetical protein
VCELDRRGSREPGRAHSSSARAQAQGGNKKAFGSQPGAGFRNTRERRATLVAVAGSQIEVDAIHDDRERRAGDDLEVQEPADAEDSQNSHKQ